MKLKTKLIIAFLTVLLLPIILGTTLIFLLGAYQISTIEKTYKISGTTVESLSNSMQTISSLTEESYHELVDMAAESPARMEDATALGEFNRLLQEKNAYLLVRKGYTMIYVGTDMENADSVIAELPDYGGAETTSENGIAPRPLSAIAGIAVSARQAARNKSAPRIAAFIGILLLPPRNDAPA